MFRLGHLALVLAAYLQPAGHGVDKLIHQGIGEVLNPHQEM
jgi:hypothetical protein